MTTSNNLGRIGIALGGAYLIGRAIGIFGSDDSGTGPTGSIRGSGSGVGGMAGPGEETTLAEREHRRRLFAGTETTAPSDETAASDVDDEMIVTRVPGSAAGVGGMEAVDEDTTLQERERRRRLFAGTERDDDDDVTAIDGSGTGTGSMEADSEETTIEERGRRRAAFAGSSSGSSADESDVDEIAEREKVIDEHIGRDGGTGGVSGL